MANNKFHGALVQEKLGNAEIKERDAARQNMNQIPRNNWRKSYKLLRARVINLELLFLG